MGIIKDTLQIAKIIITVSSLFNLTPIQETEVKNYVKLRQYQWIEQRKSEQEVEALIRSYTQQICGD